ncbi:hypothetical protein BH23GEM10_BH23GEM10_06930 [soil metagenome]
MRRLSLLLVSIPLFMPLFTASADAQEPARAPSPVHAQAAADAFLDAGAAVLFNRARDARLQTDAAIRSYTAIVSSRMAAGLRMPLKDRTLFRQETAARVRWSRDAASVVQLLGSRAQHPGGVEVANSGFGVDMLFDPSRDRLYFGFGGNDGDRADPDSAGPARADTVRADDDRARDDRTDDDYWIEHPLGETAERFYRYQSGDTLTISLHDGRLVRVIELIVIPRYDNPHTVRGALWTDAGSGALVQAAFRLARKVDLLRDMNLFDDEEDCSYRVGEEGDRQSCRDAAGMVPGFLKPFEFDISLMTVEYSLWELAHWLPRTMRFEGVIRAGVISAPASMAISYDMEDVLLDGESDESEADAADRTADEWGLDVEHRRINRKNDRRPFIVIMPTDSVSLLDSDLLPPPIWKDAPGFFTEGEIEQLARRIERLPGPQVVVRPPLRFGWGWGEPGMLRYNRVEALSLGARVTQPLPLFGTELTAVGRIGIGDLRPNVELAASRETTRRTLNLRAYHALASVAADNRAFGFGNSVSALLLGRDEGEYYRATGAALTWAPPAMRRQSWDVTGYVEDQRAVERNTQVALPRVWSDAVFRPNIVADEAVQYGAALRVRPWWGTDAAAAQAGIDVQLQAEAGDYQHARGSVTLRAAAPLFPGVRVGLEAAVGSTEGDVPVQRLFYLSGASTVRGYEPSTVTGTSMARARLEIARAYPFANLAAFSDWGWAGDRDDIRSSNVRRANERLAVGIGASLLDGFVRLDLAHGLYAPRGWRVDLHMDAVL